MKWKIPLLFLSLGVITGALLLWRMREAHPAAMPKQTHGPERSEHLGRQSVTSGTSPLPGPFPPRPVTDLEPEDVGPLPALLPDVPARIYTVAERVAEFGRIVHARLEPAFAEAGVPYPPARLTFIGLKREKRLEVYASEKDQPPRFIRSYPILAASGGPGPKLREGDRQVPEGLYRIESLTPNSLYHLSLRVDYPNALDRRRAAAEHRTDLGGDIMIHGDAVSIGCIAVGDEAAEDLFVLSALTGTRHIEVILSPADFRAEESFPAPPGAPNWTAELYASIKAALQRYPRPNGL